MKNVLINIFITLFSVSSFAINDTDTSRFRDVSVMITNDSQNHGGTGSIINSNTKGSTILTNKHVCQVVKQGGKVVTPGGVYTVRSYKEYPMHDLCLVKIKENLGQSLKLSRTLPQPADKSYVTGHPLLMPNIVTEGHFSDRVIIQVLMDVRDCTDKEREEDPVGCDFFGKEVVETFKSQVVSNLIQPGNSGSAVLNSKGELAGVVFAGRGQLGYGLIVPQDFVAFFLTNHEALEWSTPGKTKPTKQTGSDRRSKSQSNCAKTANYPTLKIAKLCGLLKQDMIYRGM